MTLSRPEALKLLNNLKKIVNEAKGNISEPMSIRIAEEFNHNPFLILISCLLSLRSRDTVTYKISRKLFAVAKTPQEILDLPLKKLEEIIYPTGFYHRKALTLKAVSREIIDRFNGQVPNNQADLLSLPGVGRKTANLVLSEAFGIPAICVDTHVHRLANHLRLVLTKTPEQTEYALEKILPKDMWIEAHRILIMCGQNPKKCDISPFLKK